MICILENRLYFNIYFQVCGITDRQYTYGQLYKQSQILGANLRRNFKIQDGDAVAIMLSNSPEYPTIILGILSAGGLVTTLNPIYTSCEYNKSLDKQYYRCVDLTLRKFVWE